jgi:Exopolysaccharide biosynthesis protein related to N-acetylglucosamine-1-phosphodiester alpha-N-acetylglucosaminidase
MKNNKRRSPLFSALYFSLSALMILLLSLLAFAPSSSKKEVSLTKDLATSFVNNQANDFISDFSGTENVKALPFDFTAPQNIPDKANYFTDGKKKCYKDSTIEVTMWSEKIVKYGTKLFFADIKIKHPSQFRRQWSHGDYSSTKNQYPTTMFANSHGVVGMSADFYKHRKYGIIVQYGTLLCDKRTGHPLDVLVVDYDGNFHIWDDKKLSAHIKENGTDDIMLSFTFGPALVIDGKETKLSAKRYENHILGELDQVVGRAAIGQLGELHYLLCTASKPGLKGQDIADVMAERHCITAYNFDGGQTGTLLFDGKVFNEIAYKGVQRDMSDIIYFASAE